MSHEFLPSDALNRTKPHDWDRVYETKIDGCALEAMSVLSKWVLDQSSSDRVLPFGIIAACDAVGSVATIVRRGGDALISRANRKG